MRKIIFLDFDGVLNSRIYDMERLNDASKGNIDETRLPLLKHIVDRTGAEIVLSTSWRIHWEKDRTKCRSEGIYFAELFDKYGLEISDKTPKFYGSQRAEEIKKWLNAQQDKICSFVILDDYPFGWERLSDNLVQTSGSRGRGLMDEHVHKAIELLMRA